jgi:hypothetical protein
MLAASGGFHATPSRGSELALVFIGMSAVQCCSSIVLRMGLHLQALSRANAACKHGWHAFACLGLCAPVPGAGNTCGMWGWLWRFCHSVSAAAVHISLSCLLQHTGSWRTYFSDWPHVPVWCVL